jgi:hypothetical protein
MKRDEADKRAFLHSVQPSIQGDGLPARFGPCGADGGGSVSTDRPHQRHEPLFDVHPVTGVSIEVFYADTSLVSFGRSGAGWFWQLRQPGRAPEGKARGPFPTSYSAYRDAFVANTPSAYPPLLTAFAIRSSSRSGR